MKVWVRLGAALLAIVTVILVILRGVVLIQQNLLTGDEAIIHILRLVFPFSLSLFFGYIAWKGILPFSKKE
jgi:hypothetical protein